MLSVPVRTSCVTPRPAGRQRVVQRRALAVATERDKHTMGFAQIQAVRQVIVEGCLTTLAAVVSPHPPLNGVMRRKMDMITRWSMRLRSAAPARVKWESADWGTETGGRALSAGPPRPGGPGGPGETRKSCGEGAGCEGPTLPLFPGVGHRGRSIAGHRKRQVPRDQRRLASVFVLASAAF